MKLFRMIARSIRDASKSVFRNFSLSIASISSITITLIIVAIAITMSYNVNNFTKVIRKDVTLVVFLKSEITKEELIEMANYVEEHNNIESYQLVTKEDIKEEMIESSEVFETIMSAWNDDENPLFDEYLIKVKEIVNIKDTANDFKEMKAVESVKYGEGIVDKLIATFDVIENASYIIVLALLLVTAFLISNTIKLTIYSRKNEIDIMRLVGASNIFIKLPYVLEGIVLGAVGAVIPVVLTIYGYTALYDYYGGQLFSPIIRLVEPTPFIYVVSAILLGIAMLIGMVGSYRAVRRYLKI